VDFSPDLWHFFAVKGVVGNMVFSFHSDEMTFLGEPYHMEPLVFCNRWEFMPAKKEPHTLW
jgi:hypothetical protein